MYLYKRFRKPVFSKCQLFIHYGSTRNISLTLMGHFTSWYPFLLICEIIMTRIFGTGFLLLFLCLEII